MFSVRLRVLPVLVLLSCFAALVGLSACGGGGNPTETLKETFSGKKKIDSGKFKLTLNLKTSGLKTVTKPINLDLSGSFQSEGKNKLPAFDIALNAKAEGQTVDAGAISTGDAGFIEFRGTTYAVPSSVFTQFKKGYEKSQKQNDKEDKGSLAKFGIDPLKWAKDEKAEDDTKVGDIEVTHVSAAVDVPAMLDNLDTALAQAGKQLGGAQAKSLPKAIPADVKKQIIEAVKTASFDVYTGKDDKILRKLTVSLSFNVPKAQQKKLNGLKSADLSFDIELTDLNEEQTITKPKSTKPLSELTKSLGGLAGLGGGGSSSSGQKLSAADQAKVAKYQQCIQDAGQDVKKAQQCAAALQ